MPRCSKITIIVCLRPQTDSTRLVSSKLMLWGASRRSLRPFWPISCKNRTKNPKNGFEPMYTEHFWMPKTMVASVSAQTAVLTDFLKNNPRKQRRHAHKLKPLCKKKLAHRMRCSRTRKLKALSVAILAQAISAQEALPITVFCWA